MIKCLMNSARSSGSALNGSFWCICSVLGRSLGSLEKSRDGMMMSFVTLAIADRASTEPQSDGQSDAYKWAITVRTLRLHRGI